MLVPKIGFSQGSVCEGGQFSSVPFGCFLHFFQFFRHLALLMEFFSLPMQCTGKSSQNCVDQVGQPQIWSNGRVVGVSQKVGFGPFSLIQFFKFFEDNFFQEQFLEMGFVVVERLLNCGSNEVSHVSVGGKGAPQFATGPERFQSVIAILRILWSLSSSEMNVFPVSSAFRVHTEWMQAAHCEFLLRNVWPRGGANFSRKSRFLPKT